MYLTILAGFIAVVFPVVPTPIPVAMTIVDIGFEIFKFVFVKDNVVSIKSHTDDLPDGDDDKLSDPRRRMVA
jgi:hypothetical protein